MKISVSDLELYLKCPRAYQLHVLEEALPQSKSLLLCKAITAKRVISHLHSEAKKLGEFSSEEIAQLCECIWQKEISDPLVNQEELNAVAIQAKAGTKTKPATENVTEAQKALAQIITWCTSYAKLEQEARVVATNVYFEDQIGDVTFHGSIDQIREHPQDGFQIIVFKTSCQVPLPVYLARDFAISLAVHAVWQGTLFPRVTSEETRLEKIPAAYVYYLPYLEHYQRNQGKSKKGDRKGNPQILVPRSQNVLIEFEYEILRVVLGIQMKQFPMRVVNPCGCAICPFTHQCHRATAEMVSEYEEVLA